jgi:uncharacterized membrane protein
MYKRFAMSFAAACALVVLMTATGCSSTPERGLNPAEEQMMLDLDKRYATGKMSKEEYDRQRAEIHARAQRESVEAGSPMNESIRGMRVRP